VITWKSLLFKIVWQFVPVIWTEWYIGVHPSNDTAAGFLVQQKLDQRHHIRITIKICRLFKRAVWFPPDITQMCKVDAIS
jgi:hypothetical protein